MVEKSVERLVSRPSLLISARVTCLAGSSRARSYRLRSRLSFATLPLPILGSSWFLATFLTNIAKRVTRRVTYRSVTHTRLALESCTWTDLSFFFWDLLRQKNASFLTLIEWTWDEFLFFIFKYRIHKS